MDFLKRLLVRDIHYRISTADALKHPFITGAAMVPKYLPSKALKSSVDSGK